MIQGPSDSQFYVEGYPECRTWRKGTSFVDKWTIFLMIRAGQM